MSYILKKNLNTKKYVFAFSTKHYKDEQNKSIRQCFLFQCYKVKVCRKGTKDLT